MNVESIIQFWVAVSAGLLCMATVFGIGWNRAARRARRFEEHLLGRVAPEPSATELEALRENMGMLADQVDRLAEGQEFLSRVLTQHRPDALPRPESSRVITPH